MLRWLTNAMLFVSGLAAGIGGMKPTTFDGFLIGVLFVAAVLLALYEDVENSY